MAQRRRPEALLAYETSLEIWPNRYRSLLDAPHAARGDDDSTDDAFTNSQTEGGQP